ncbi:unnamed protein product [Allacma fusca]|uniref:Uncharacterized protein n=1 Tax=Allacma fusca TaxID=39272 RepID=A0A8J2KUI2_9HEXA|nr:unnamed protein product [Allacma fusca]
MLESTANDSSESETRRFSTAICSKNKSSVSPGSSSDESDVIPPKRKKFSVTLPQAPVFLPTNDLFNIEDVNGICTGENQPLIIDILEEPPPGETNAIGSNVEAGAKDRILLLNFKN